MDTLCHMRMVLTLALQIICSQYASISAVGASLSNGIDGNYWGRPPNFVILLLDDLGYGDLSGYGHPTTVTPNIDYLLKKGKYFTQFLVGSSVCSPSRASLLTSKYPVETGVWPGVFFPHHIGGLNIDEVTIADLLRDNGYSSHMIGKWHLGIGKKQEYLPLNFGFDSYFGVPYSHDMCPCPVCFPPSDSCMIPCNPSFVPCPLYQNHEIVLQPINLTELTFQYTSQAMEVINRSVHHPFFLIMSYHNPHHPQFSIGKFYNSSLRGHFGDSLLSVDWSVGQIMKHLNHLDILKDTLIWFLSDNGPSLMRHELGGSAGLLKCGKGTTYEGGFRVPSFVFWDKHIHPGKSMELVSSLDILPTLASIARVNFTSSNIRGFDLSKLLFEDEKSPRSTFIYYPEDADPKIGLFAIRHKEFKVHFYTKGAYLSDDSNPDCDCRSSSKLTHHNPPLLFNLATDPSERYPLNVDLYKSVVRKIFKIKEQAEKEILWKPSEILKGTDPLVEPCCPGACNDFPACCVCSK